MTVTWDRAVTEVTWESATAPGVTWTTIVGGTGGAVDSVNGQTGVVVLGAADVGALGATAGAGGALSGNYPNPGLNDEAVQDLVGAMVNGNTETGAALTYDDTNGKLDIAVAYGTSAGTSAQGNDSRLSDARTPTSHASSHASDGSDPLTLAQSQITGLTSDLALKAPLASPTLTGVPTAPTAPPGTDSTQIATTAFVLANGGGGAVPAWFYGDGSDGTVTISVDTTLTRIHYFENLTVLPGVRLRTMYPIHVRGVLNLGGTIHNDGATASNPTLVVNQTYQTGGDPGNGATGNGGYANGGYTPTGPGGAGGTGGNSGTGNVGRAAPISTQGMVTAQGRIPLAWALGAVPNGSINRASQEGGPVALRIGGGAGGGGGAGDGVNAGGHGGSGGGLCVVIARTITGSGSVTANGGNASNGTGGNSGGGGGGGGGIVCIITDDATISITSSAVGGTGGLKTGSGTNGTNGTNGGVMLLLGES